MRLGVVEQAPAWPFECRTILVRYEKEIANYLG